MIKEKKPIKLCRLKIKSQIKKPANSQIWDMALEGLMSACHPRGPEITLSRDVPNLK